MKHRLHLPLYFLGLIASLRLAVAVDITAALQQEVAANTASAPAAINRTLKAAGPNAASLAGPATIAAIQSLGADATSKQIAAIVFAAVRAVPDSALRIVRAAVSTAPNAAPEIAAAAARAVPNPWKEVRYQQGAPPATSPQNTTLLAGNREPDFKSTVDPTFLDALAAVLDPAAPGDPMSLAEAIVQTAVDTNSSVSLAAVQGAVDAALYGDPGELFNRVGGVRGISGVGDAGNSNYANEPFDPNDPNGPKAKKKGLVVRGPNNPNPNPVSP
ncbi:MAG: hypothetical protein ABJF10_06140 [Chthoniobacter sp.]|uniref:hypothetical protein n=1 Tax=Chthoniobacter sp. TaxID=2510640 RepID=UPI0032A8DF58